MPMLVAQDVLIGCGCAPSCDLRTITPGGCHTAVLLAGRQQLLTGGVAITTYPRTCLGMRVHESCHHGGQPALDLVAR
jgi:hypothetical protein